MKIGAVTLAYNDEGTISGTLKCLSKYVDKHVVLISQKPYFGEGLEPDNTENICIDNDVDIIKGIWPLDHMQRNLGNKMCSDCDWVLGFDSDEMMEGAELEKLLDFLRVTKADAVCIKPEVYWHTTDYRLSPTPSYAPVIAMRPNVKFTHIRNIDRIPETYNGTMHHLSWCAPKDILKKVRHYAHASDFNGDIWYKTHYENWTPDQKFAVLPDNTYKVEKNPLPKELSDYL